jgi:Outer membrane protein beta-barrel domain
LSLDIQPLRLEVSPEILYASRGAGIEIGALTGSYDLSYLAVAVLPRIAYSLGGVTPYLVVGPELAFLLSGEIVNSMGNVTDIEDNFTSTDFGLVIGLGADVPISSQGALVFELRATLGLVSIDGQGDGDDIKNRGLLFMLGYQY